MGKGEGTRQRIIELAAPLFNMRGYDGCSMQDILSVTGLAKGGLYRHFASKEELAAEAFRYAVSQALTSRLEDSSPADGAVEQLRQMVDHFAEKPSPIPGGCPILNTAIDSDDGNPTLRGLAKEGLHAWRERVMAIIEQGIERHELKSEIEPLAMANRIIATLEGALMISRLEGSRAPLRDACAWIKTMIAQAEAGSKP